MGLRLLGTGGFKAPPKSVITSLALAGFAGESDAGARLVGAGGRRCRGARKATPASFRYFEAVSRRTPVVSSIRRNAQPNRPSAITCCCLSWLKTLLTLTEGIALRPCQCPDDRSILVAGQATFTGRF